MSKKLIITEKPSVARQFASALGVSGSNKGYIENDEWVITWCVGHLVTLSYPEKYREDLAKWGLESLPFLPKEYKYEVIRQSADQYKVVKELLNRSDVSVIYNAGDSGREGEYIQRLVYTQAGVEGRKKILRVWIDSQTNDEILRGIREAKPESDYDNLSAAAYERAIADYAVGINLSRALSCKFGWNFNQKIKSKKYIPLSVGRVMTCTLGMIVDREREIRNFVPTNYYKIDAEHEGFTSHWKPVKDTQYFESPLLYNENGFKDRKDAETLQTALGTDPSLTVLTTNSRVEKKKAPLLFNLAELQAECSKRYKIAPSQTLEIAQSLYEKKLTTYPRTDARVLSTAVAKEIDKNIRGIKTVLGWPEPDTILSNNWTAYIEKSKYVDDSKITDHYAIIPTGDGQSELGGLMDLERKVYELICRRFLAIFYPAAEYDKTDLELIHSNGEHFFASEKILTKNGYLDVYKSDQTEQTGKSNKLGSIARGQRIPAQFKIIDSQTQPPKPYTSGSIILAMENAGKLIEDEELRNEIKGSGIGTSATRAEIITKLVKLTYIALNKKTQILSPTATGEALYDIVRDNIPSLLSPKMTASWEKGLSQVEDGTITADKYRVTLEKFVADSVAKVKSAQAPVRQKLEKTSAGTCPVCGKELFMTENGYFCSGYKRTGAGCKFGFSKTIGGHTLTEDETKLLLSGRNTDVITGFVSKTGKPFDAQLVIDRNDAGAVKMKFPTKTSNMICPKCGNAMDEGTYNYECSCGLTFPVKMASRSFTQDDIDCLVKQGYREISGFRNKAGKEFSATVVYKNGKTEFDFGPNSKSNKTSRRKK